MRILQLVSIAASLCLWAISGHAGAWPRGAGNTFVSSAAIVTWPKGRAIELPDVYGSFYAEHGLSAHWTLGLDIGSAEAGNMDRTKIVGFARRSFNPNGSAYQIALDLGLGVDEGEPVARLGAAYGRGIKTLGRNGWISLEMSHHITRTARVASSYEATAGVTFDRSKLIAQLSAHRSYSGQMTHKVTPSYVRSFGTSSQLELGLVLDLNTSPDPTLKIGIWHEF